MIFRDVSATMAPTGRGSVKLKSSDPYDTILLNTATFSNAKDLASMVEAVKAAARFAAAPAWKDYIIQPIGDLANATTDAQIEAYIKSTGGPLLHGVATCSMSAKHDKNGVVGPDLCVKKVAGLRVVDASVLVREPTPFGLSLLSLNFFL